MEKQDISSFVLSGIMQKKPLLLNRLFSAAFFLCLSILAGCGGSGGSATPPTPAGDSLEAWHWRNPLPQGNQLNGVAYGRGLFVAVSSGSTIITSPDGVHWTAVTTGAIQGLNAITYGNGLFVAVGGYETPSHSYSGTVATSADGINWTVRNDLAISNYSRLFGVAFGNGIFVAVGELGTIFTSPDGITWSAGTSVTSENLTAVTFGNGVFVAVGFRGTILTSVDGKTWSQSISGTQATLYGAGHGNGLFVAVGGTYGGRTSPTTGIVLTSDDGITWNVSAATGSPLSGIAFGNNTFVATGGVILVSGNGMNWNEHQAPATSLTSSVVWGNNVFVSVWAGAVKPDIAVSPDGASWGAVGKDFLADVSGIRSIAYGNSTFVMVGWSGAIFTSPDGIIWTPSPDSGKYGDLYCVRFINGAFLAVGQ